MKVKEKDPNTSLRDLRVKTPDGRVGLWAGQWAGGVWLGDGKTGHVYPIFLDKLSEAGEWEVTEETINISVKKNQ